MNSEKVSWGIPHEGGPTDGTDDTESVMDKLDQPRETSRR